ncbi:MAG TPA: hypothetical protein VLN48_03235 [Bryobacteraceae bacterium]|nr:hypothetical protein [Bryobacteraceae bacterium]
MACPFFMPSRRLEHVGWVRPPRLPLGDPWGGTCHARADNIVEPPDLQQRELCNCGYARGRCERFPGGEAPDATRFSITSDTGGVVRLVYIFEKDHAPASHGVLEFPGSGEVSGVSDLLAQQAKAFLESYLHRRAPVGKPATG